MTEYEAAHLIVRIFNKLELAIHRAKVKFNENMTAHTLADAVIHEVSKMAKELEDANPTR